MRWNIVASPHRVGGLGLRCAKQQILHIAFMGKLVWSMIAIQQNLWIQLMDSKYLSWHFVFKVAVRSSNSITWKSNLKAASELCDNFRYKVGKGDISFCYEN